MNSQDSSQNNTEQTLPKVCQNIELANTLWEFQKASQKGEKITEEILNDLKSMGTKKPE